VSIQSHLPKKVQGLMDEHEELEHYVCQLLSTNIALKKALLCYEGVHDGAPVEATHEGKESRDGSLIQSLMGAIPETVRINHRRETIFEVNIEKEFLNDLERLESSDLQLLAVFFRAMEREGMSDILLDDTRHRAVEGGTRNGRALLVGKRVIEVAISMPANTKKVHFRNILIDRKKI